MERALNSTELGSDLRSCKRLLLLHQALEQELSQCEQRAESLAAQGSDLVSSGLFDGAAIERDSAALLQTARALRPRAAERRQALETSPHSVTSSRGRHPSAARCHPQLPQAQQQLRAEKEARDDWFKDVLARGQRLLDEERPSSAEIEERCRAAGGVGAADRLALLPERR
ncbi:unnamed protein product [Danaus chrysippus]|uniref:(African queen) hypothetical protein n=1 Tax=Danaus chrysippus TaxID=151541 RepID=A0A8J2WBH7_9NEOP|nr:unnamed protein product [Danaus chrysippus]